MITVRKAEERGPTRIGWLDSMHCFSFGGYHDPRYMGFGDLLVINEDRVLPGAGFGTHPHADMEIISYVLEGALEHKDSIGTGSVIRPGEIQRMSGGTGIRHSEFNASKTEPVHFLQIWIQPGRTGIAPSYEQRAMPTVDGPEARLDLIGSPDGREGSVTIHQDAKLYRATLSEGGRVTLPLAAGRRAWLQVVRGAVEVSNFPLKAGDGLAVVDEPAVEIAGALAGGAAEVLLFDLR